MKFDKNLAAIHAYLCADGYVVRNPSNQKNKYYHIGFRNTNLILLKDFQKRFYNYFKVEPHLYKGERCQLGSKYIYEKLIKNFGSFYSKEWKMPILKEKLAKIWLRAFFDCEGWVFCKTHQNRHIGVDSINKMGLDQVNECLNKIGIKTIKKENKKRGIFRILIYGKSNLNLFQQEIGFLHPDKRKRLDEAISDYIDYNWGLEKNENLIRKIMLEKAKLKRPHTIRVISKEKNNLEKLSNYLNDLFLIQFIKINKSKNGLGNTYFELNINKKEEFNKLIKYNLINKKQLNKVKEIMN